MISRINGFYANNRNKNNSQVNFKSGRIDVIKYALNKKKCVDRHMIANFLDIPSRSELLSGINAPLKRYRAGFLFRLADKFMSQKAKLSNEQQMIEKSNIFSLYSEVKYPTNAHKKLIYNNNYSIGEIRDIIVASKNKKYLLELAEKIITLYKGVERKEPSIETVKSFMNMKYAKKVNKNFDLYKPFIELNRNLESAAYKLDIEIMTKSSSIAQAKDVLSVIKLKETSPFFNTLTEKKAIENYSPARINLMDSMHRAYFGNTDYARQRMLINPNLLDSIYVSTNESNYKIRRAIISDAKSSEGRISPESLLELFDKVDADSQAHKSVKYLMMESNRIFNPKNYNTLLDEVNSQKLYEHREEALYYFDKFGMDENTIKTFKSILESPEKTEQLASDTKKHMQRVYAKKKEYDTSSVPFKEEFNMFIQYLTHKS